MTTITLDSLELTAEERRRCQEAIRCMAYEKWVRAGQPDGDGREFWMQAEREWIERCYVPHRLDAENGCACRG